MKSSFNPSCFDFIIKCIFLISTSFANKYDNIVSIDNGFWWFFVCVLESKNFWSAKSISDSVSFFDNSSMPFFIISEYSVFSNSFDISFNDFALAIFSHFAFDIFEALEINNNFLITSSPIFSLLNFLILLCSA